MMQFRCVPVESRPRMPRQRVWNVLAASITASDRFMRLNTGRLGPASPASSGSAKRFRGRVELLDRTRAGLLLGVERILDIADEEARLVDPSAQDALRRRPSSSPMDFSTFSTDARTCCSRSLKPGRLSPLTWSKWVKMTCSLLALPETAMPLRAATGAACIGWAALSTSNTAATRPPLPRGMQPQSTTWRPDDGPVSRGKE